MAKDSVSTCPSGDADARLPLSHKIGSRVGAELRSIAKYRQVVAFQESFSGIGSRSPRSRLAPLASVATTTCMPWICVPSESLTPVSVISPTVVLSRKTPGFHELQSCSGIAWIPPAGSAAVERPISRKTYSILAESMLRLESKKIPPRNGRKNLSMIRSEKPTSRKRSRVL